jgi:nucleoid-associated protein YgaU
VLVLCALSGCGYVHLGRLPQPAAVVVGDAQLLKENTDLRTEKKILQQELALTRAQGEALRSAIENRTADGDTSKRLTEKLNETTRDLATLRTSYARLQLERASAPAATPAEIADLKSKLGATEDKLAGSLRNYTQLQEEIGRLRTEVNETRAVNTALTEKVKVVTAQNDEAQAALAQVNVDLLAQKESRTHAEQDAVTLRTQLETANTKLSALAQQRTAPATGASALAAPAGTAADSADPRVQLETLRKKVWSLESERNALQQQLSAIEAAGKTPGLAELKARAESEAKLTAALESAKMLRDENDHLKSSTAELIKTRLELEAEVATARAATPLAAQLPALREQLRQAQTQASTLADENSRLKARLAAAGGSPGSGVATVQPFSGVTATFVTSGSSLSSGAGSSGGRTSPSGAPLRFHTVAGGDTLSKISNLYYGTTARWAEILVANRDVLGEDNNLVVGRTLRIP